MDLRYKWVDEADRSFGPPAAATKGSAGVDVRANLRVDDRCRGIMLCPMERILIPTGLRIEVPVGFELQLRPRSGLSLHHGVSLINSPGTIDCDYRGEIGVILINLGRYKYVVRHGDRIAQMVLCPVTSIEFGITNEFEESERGKGGFGSTGLT